MARFSITLPDTLHEQLAKLAEKNHKTLSQTIRELIESGLEIERLSNDPMSGNHQNNDAAFPPEKEKILWKHLLSWSLETRILVRGLFEKILEKNMSDVMSEVQKIKEKSESRVIGLLELNED
jgi:hypothetical protein